MFIVANYLMLVLTDVVECAEIKKQFRDFLVTKLRMAYSKVVRKLIHIFKEKKDDIEELVTILCFDDVEKISIFSTDNVFNTIRTEFNCFNMLPNIVKAFMIIEFFMF